ncbi:MAG: hypothetical protein ACI91J_002362, partial [Yoonia sp.]
MWIDVMQVNRRNWLKQTGTAGALSALAGPTLASAGISQISANHAARAK